MAPPKSKNLQRYLLSRNPEAKSAKLKEAVDMLETLKRIPTNTNPRAINAVGPQNLAGLLQQLRSLFPNDFGQEIDAKLSQINVQQLVNAQNPNNVFRPIDSTTFALPNTSSPYAPIGAAFVVTESSPDLTNERIVTNTNTIVFDTSVTGQLKAHVNVAGLSINTSANVANTTVQGVTRLATIAEANTGTSESIAVTPAGLNAAIVYKISQIPSVNVANTTVQGVVELATVAEAIAGLSSTHAVTPEGMAAHVDDAISGISSSTNLGIANRTDTTLDVTSDTGTDATVPAANTTLAGLMTAADKAKLDGISAGANTGQPPGGANTQVQFNDSTNFGGSAGFTFDKTTNNVVIANTLDVSIARLGNSTVNVFTNSTLLTIRNATDSSNIGAGQILTGINVINTTAIAVGSNLVLNSSEWFIGNTTVNAFANSLLIQFSNSTTTSNLTSSRVSLGANSYLSTNELSIGNSTVNVFANSTGFRQNGVLLSAPYYLSNVVVFTANGTWTKPAGCIAILTKGVGGGGGGGGSRDVDSTGPYMAQGGGGGGYCEEWFLASEVGATETITIGLGGNGGSNLAANGLSGSNTTFGAHWTAQGGAGGRGGNNVFGTGLGTGGPASGADINIPGDCGEGVTTSGGTKGGASLLGFGGQDVHVTSNGTVGQNYGGGGGGARAPLGNGRAGGNGAPGILIIYEFST